jgi:hypothetical protein
MDRSLLYHDAFGMEVPALPASGRVTGTRVTLEIMEIQDVPHQTILLRMQDPGTATLVFFVRDVDAVLTRAAQAKAVVARPGGKPVTLADGARSILIRDVDGDMRISITVNNMDETTKVFATSWASPWKARASSPQTPRYAASRDSPKPRSGAAASRHRGPRCGSNSSNSKASTASPFSMRIQDRGAARLQLRVQDVDAVVTAVKAAGLKIMSTDGVAHAIPPYLKGALVADPNNFLLTPYSPCDGCAGIGVPASATK